MLYTGNMTRIHFEPEARQTLAEAYHSDESLSNIYDFNFDLLRADPIDPRARRHRFTELDAWIVYVEIPGRPHGYAIIWHEVEGEVYVLYLGPWV